MKGQELRELFFSELKVAEQNQKITKARISGVDIWPVIRNWIMFVDYSSHVTFHGKQKRKKKKYFVLIKLFYFFTKLLICKRDYLFFANGYYLTNFQGELLHKFFTPILDQVSAKSLVFYQGSSWKCGEASALSLQSLMLFFDILSRLKASFPIENKKISSILHLSKQYFSKADIKQLRQKLISFLIKKEIYIFILRIQKPKIVFLVNYYDVNHQPLVFAANKLKIPIVDIQHGVQSGKHIAYNAWKDLPIKGFNSVVDSFWHWDKLSSANNAKQLGDTVLRYVTGNIWLNYVISQTKDFDSYQKIINGRKMILFCAQPFSVPFPPSLVATIKATAAKYCWVIRLHPTMEAERQRFQQLLNELGIGELVFMQQFADAQLFVPLHLCDLHVCISSSTTIEASLLGKPTIVLDPSGKEFYEEYEEENQIVYHFEDVSFEELVSSILSASRKPSLIQQYATINFENLIDQNIKDYHRKYID